MAALPGVIANLTPECAQEHPKFLAAVEEWIREHCRTPHSQARLRSKAWLDKATVEVDVQKKTGDILEPPDM
eukprot:10174662-Prorocentrum_lima.AAC.1